VTCTPLYGVTILEAEIFKITVIETSAKYVPGYTVSHQRSVIFTITVVTSSKHIPDYTVSRPSR
jgi:hypothetical protein